MYKHLLWALLLVVISCTGKKDSQVPPLPESFGLTYEPFPEGYGYLQDSLLLAGAVRINDSAYIRDHAWKLWAGITQPASEASWPIWFTWPNTKPAFAKAGPLSGSAGAAGSMSLIESNMANIVFDTAFANLLPIYPIPPQVAAQYGTDFSIGSRFLFNGDIMIPTEALSMEAYKWIRYDSVFLQSKLQQIFESGQHILNSPTKFISTKHMFWPVKQDTLSALPVWAFDYPADYDKYAGYENWNTLVAIDPSNKYVGQTVPVTYLYGVLNPDSSAINPITKNAEVVSLNDFYYHQVTQYDWDSLFDDTDRAILSASSYWAYNRPFEPGDYLVTVAMHVLTKELPTWTMQSVWWSNNPEESSYSKNRPQLPSAVGPWDHYLLTTSYGNVNPVTQMYDVEMNPYIELVIHPVGTSCQNCHVRAGWPKAPFNTGKPGLASYQNDDCPILLEPLKIDAACLSEYLLTDFSWMISDQAIK